MCAPINRPFTRQLVDILAIALSFVLKLRNQLLECVTRLRLIGHRYTATAVFWKLFSAQNAVARRLVVDDLLISTLSDSDDEGC